MKNKHCLAVALTGGAVCLALRLLQHLFIIDSDGYFTADGIPQTLLIWGLYGAFAVALIMALVIIFTGSKRPLDAGVIQSAGSLSVLYIIAAALIMLHSGICLVTSEKAPVLLVRLLAVSGIISAVYFAGLGFGTLKNRMSPILYVLGLFPPAYICIFGVCEFYKSFEHAQKSETVMQTVTACSLTLFITAICLSAAGVTVTRRRMAALSTVYPIFAATTGPLFFMSDKTPGDIVFSFIQMIFILIALIVVLRIDYVKPHYDYKPDDSDLNPDKSPDLDMYMNDIPDTEE